MMPAAAPADRHGTVYAITKLIVGLWLFAATASAAGQDVAPGSLRGVVVDARTGAPIPKVLVALEGGRTTETAADGTFAFDALPPGATRLYVSAVGYGLVQRALQIVSAQPLEIRVPLTEGAATYQEDVTVQADRFDRPEIGVPSQQTLRGGELQELRGVLADDALRAVQVMPGVATGDDFRSEFSVRGSDFAHTNFTVDGFATPFLMHMVRAVEERANTGSVAMINSDVLSEVVLSNGAYVQRTGNRTGPELAFTIRDGTRERPLFRASVSGTSASLTAEGPLGSGRRGSWLVSGRKSYLDLVIDRLREEGLSFGFADGQAKFRYDASPRQSVFVTMLAGDSRLEELPRSETDTELFIGNNGSGIVIGGWRGAFRRGVVSAGSMLAHNAFRNHTAAGLNLEDGRTTQVAARVDATWGLTPGVELESGILVERASESQTRRQQAGASRTVTLNDYRAGGVRSGGYVGLRVKPGKGLVILPGVRADRWSLTDQSTVSPWVQAAWEVHPGVTVRAAGGVYQQFPAFEAAVGAFSAPDVRPERSLHADVGVERRLTETARLQVTVYWRGDEDVMRRPGAETRLLDGRFIRGSRTARYANRLDGDARGLEVLLQRRATEGLTGWFSYAYGRNRYEDAVTGEQHWGDLDQRHTVNAYAAYRFSHRFSGSVKLRTGSNFPIPGYYARDGDSYVLSERRNELRLPAYARLDVRVNRTFDWSRRRLTLFAEVLNVLNRDNVRFNPPRINSTTLRVTRLYESLVPVVPSAGLLLEF